MPVAAIVLSVCLSIVMVVLNYLDTGWLLTFMLNSAGASLLIVWTFIAVSELRLRRRLEQHAGEALPIRMWGFPWLTIVTLVVLAGLAVLMLTDPGSRVQLFSAATMFAILVVASFANSAIRGLSPFEKLPLPEISTQPR